MAFFIPMVYLFSMLGLAYLTCRKQPEPQKVKVKAK